MTRAIVGFYSDFNDSNRSLDVTVSFYEYGSGVEHGTVSVYFDPLVSLDEWFAAVKIAVLTYATDHSITIDENNIIWANGNLFNPPAAQALNGIQSISIDGKTVANTTVFTNTSGKNLLVTDVFILPTSFSGGGTPPIINVGKNGGSYLDIVNGLSLSALTALGTFIKTSPINGASIVANNESIVVRVSVAALLYTTYNFKVVIQGIYLD